MTEAQETGWTATANSLASGVWTVRLEGGADAPKVEATLAHRVIGAVTQTQDGSAVIVAVDLPKEVLSDGLQSIHLVEKKYGTTVASLHIASGRAVSQDIAVELALLRDELALLKKAFRRHLSE